VISKRIGETEEEEEGEEGERRERGGRGGRGGGREEEYDSGFDASRYFNIYCLFILYFCCL
tara:strand:+ start:474 stop:656 length:183 start_codon:yes stop_codon:yes gene_type:complete